ncbi:uncharacterized protein LOC125500995 [Athalia rosae]|uniref:uncharacterized protein LOC125500995 n=1 Tax=Athalia rosae TaxID=37344 RepID=UPI0020338999|nr:uncharacterized protein LOC125500995 [Athalia rosae]
MATINCDKKGFQALLQHCATAKHTANARTKLDVHQLHLTKKPSNLVGQTLQASETDTPNQIELFSSKSAATKAEILWCLKIVVSDWSAASSQGIPDLFKEMFPNSVPIAFTLSPAKLRYVITVALGPYFRETILEDCSAAWYTLIYDETTNNESKKELQVALRYWSETEELVVIHHLETFFLGQAKAEDLEESIYKALDNAGLPVHRLLMLGSDGPNVNKKVFRLVNEHAKIGRNKGLLDIGTCNIHIVHNAFLKGLEQLGHNVSQLAIQVFYYFDGWPKRWEDYTIIQQNCSVPFHRFIKHVPSRWLTLQDSARRLLEQWEAIREFFLKAVPKQKQLPSKHGDDIATTLKNPTLKAEICFVIESADVHQSFTRKYHCQEPLIHDELKLLFHTLAGRICKTHVLANPLNENDPFLHKNLLPVAEVYCTSEVQDILKSLPGVDRVHFLKKAQNHYLEAAKHILTKTCLFIGTVTKHFRCLQPEAIKKEAFIRSIQKIVDALPLEISSIKLADEWKMLAMEKLPDNKSQRIDHFWREIMKLKTGLGEQKYPNISKIVKASLSLSHGSADIERGFSSSGRILTQDKTAMSLKTLNAKIYIKDGMKRFQNKPELVPMTKKLILAAESAHLKYKNYLEEVARAAKEEEVTRNAEKPEIEKKRALKEKMEQSRKKLKILETEFKSADQEEKQQRKLADKLFTEANDRLNRAIGNKDMEEIQLAQSMLQSVKHLRKEEDNKKSKRESIYKKLEVKKSYLINKADSK